MSLLDDPLQLLIVGAIVVVFLVMGPKKIPELARALGQARGEFALGAAQKPLAGATETATPTLSESDARLIETAEKLGIQTRGKTAQQISNEIVAKGSR